VRGSADPLLVVTSTAWRNVSGTATLRASRCGSRCSSGCSCAGLACHADRGLWRHPV